MAKQDYNESILTDAQDIVVVRPSSQGYVFAAKPSIDFQRQTYEESVSGSEDRGARAFSQCWEFDDHVGIKGSSTFHALRYDKKALRSKGLWLPGFTEARFLEKQGKLENGVYRDYDLVVYSDEDFNTEIAKELSGQAKQLGFALPVVSQFRALDYDVNSKSKYGIDLRFVEKPQGIIHGREAQEAISSLNYKRNSGALGLLRDTYGNWLADWYYLGNSYSDGRVDWICGEATRADLVKAHESLVERKYSNQIKELEEKQVAEFSQFEKSLTQ
ncbi:MAG: hypothetical protein KKF48_02260 [Nanoarchaeota archaeon]|nr:hypothetical protein [Nanoarchaeota archaeon]MBU1027843.1 hypothetical protein [Nanoarchaeota archaeon]